MQSSYCIEKSRQEKFDNHIHTMHQIQYMVNVHLQKISHIIRHCDDRNESNELILDLKARKHTQNRITYMRSRHYTMHNFL